MTSRRTLRTRPARPGRKTCPDRRALPGVTAKGSPSYPIAGARVHAPPVVHRPPRPGASKERLRAELELELRAKIQARAAATMEPTEKTAVQA